MDRDTPATNHETVCSFARFQQYKALKQYQIRDEVLREVYDDHMIDFAVSEKLSDLHKASYVYSQIALNNLCIEGTRASLGLPVQPKEICHEQEDPVY